LLLENAIRLYDEGHLHKSAREELSTWIPYLSSSNADRRLLVKLLNRLMRDLYLPVRELTGGSLSLADPELSIQLQIELERTRDDTGWAQACAIYQLAFWNGNEEKIKAACRAEDPIMRDAGEAALEMLHKRLLLQQLNELFISGDSLSRLASYLSLKEQGNELSISFLKKLIKQEELPSTFLHSLGRAIHKRSNDDREKRWDKEKKFLTSVGLAWFE
jgi:hypothetical protein